MADPVGQLVTEALSLPEKSRAFIAEKLLESLDAAEDFVVSEQWRDEIRRRCQELDANESQTIPAEEVFADLRTRLG